MTESDGSRPGPDDGPGNDPAGSPVEHQPPDDRPVTDPGDDGAAARGDADPDASDPSAADRGSADRVVSDAAVETTGAVSDGDPIANADPDADPDDTGPGDEVVAGGGATTPAWARGVIFGGAALILLLVGATIGLLIGRSDLLSEPTDPGPSEVDIGFSQDMSVHHLQAVRMSNIAWEHSEDDQIRRLAFDISSTQQGQVGRMQGWLTLWGAPDQATGEVMSWMDGGHGEHGGHGGHGDDQDLPEDVAMPGMATQDEMNELAGLRGEELDVRFLQLMLRHHQGGAPMADNAAERAAIPAVRALAQSMSDSQGAEMRTMRQMLSDRDATPIPFR